MSVLPVSRLSSADLTLLGNNLVPELRGRRRAALRHRRQARRELAAVNRSLAALGERLPRQSLA
jgi:hypothetical protein